MLKSMTAFGRSTLTSHLGRFTLEIQSVNRKFLEFSFNLPREFSKFEMEMRKWITEKVNCGQINITLRAKFDQEAPFAISPNIPLAKEVYNAWAKIAEALQLDIQKDFDLKLLSTQSGILIYEENSALEEEYRTLLKDLVNAALTNFLQFRDVEGQALKDDFEKRLQFLEKCMLTVKERSHLGPEKYKAKIAAKLQELLPERTMENEERLIRELVILSEKMDVQEEITRFYSHINQFRVLLEGSEQGVGKNMDFLTQEIGRELNTLGSKTTDLETSKFIVEMKTELARIKEQVQNVE